MFDLHADVTLFGATVGPAAVIGCIYLFTSLQAKTMVFFFAWNAVGVVVYLLYGRAKSGLAAA